MPEIFKLIRDDLERRNIFPPRSFLLLGEDWRAIELGIAKINTSGENSQAAMREVDTILKRYRLNPYLEVAIHEDLEGGTTEVYGLSGKPGYWFDSNEISDSKSKLFGKVELMVVTKKQVSSKAR